MKVAVFGGTGRTGALVVQELLNDGHEVTMLVRNAAKASAFAGQVSVVTGDVRDTDAVRRALEGTQAVASALGPVVKDATLLRDAARIVIAEMARAHISRYVGISVAGLTLPGDSKRFRDKIISWLLNRLGGELAKDKIAEYEAWNRSGFDWTLVRVPRLTDGPMGDVDVDTHVSGRRTTLSRASLARFIAAAIGDDSFTRTAPFVSDR
ncbi:NAD(P)H-binding protein [Microbacterium sp. GbtcB4]|uniref:NAD(P)-dependent oxidoreductase n=1 Tax=Microbacterium sp. GbtcB4 TaxID=2824749 RepID=UPI001C2F29BB